MPFTAHTKNIWTYAKEKVMGGRLAVVRELRGPFSADSFLSANATRFESADHTQNYLPKSQRAS